MSKQHLNKSTLRADSYKKSAGLENMSRRSALAGLLGVVSCSGSEVADAKCNKRGTIGNNTSSEDDALERILLQQSRGVANVLSFGAKGDCITIDILPSITSGRIVTSREAAFKKEDAGKSIALIGASINGGAIVAKIERVISSISVELNKQIDQHGGLTKAIFGTDDTDALQRSLNSGSVVLVPEGFFFHERLYLKSRSQVIIGNSITDSILFCPSGTGIVNYQGSDESPIDDTWVGNFVIKSISLVGGFAHSDVFSPPNNSWSNNVGREKKLSQNNLNLGIQLKRCYPYSLHDVEIRNFHRAVFVAGGAMGRWSNFKVADCEVGFWGENGASWGDVNWKVTTHSWRDGIFTRCWIGIGGGDLVQCEVQGKTVDFEPCNTGIALVNGGDNIWSGYFELCSEGIYRTGSSMGMDVIQDPFFAGKKGSFWGVGDSILLDRNVGPGGGIILRDDGRDVSGGGLRVLGGRLKRPGYYFGAKVPLAAGEKPISAPQALVWGGGDVLDTMFAFHGTRGEILSIAPMFSGAMVRLRLSCLTSTAAGEVGRKWVEFRRNGVAFSGTARGTVSPGRMQPITIESGPIKVAAGDAFTVYLETDAPTVFHSGAASWFGMDLLD